MINFDTQFWLPYRIYSMLSNNEFNALERTATNKINKEGDRGYLIYTLGGIKIVMYKPIYKNLIPFLAINLKVMLIKVCVCLESFVEVLTSFVFVLQERSLGG